MQNFVNIFIQYSIEIAFLYLIHTCSHFSVTIRKKYYNDVLYVYHHKYNVYVRICTLSRKPYSSPTEVSNRSNRDWESEPELPYFRLERLPHSIRTIVEIPDFILNMFLIVKSTYNWTYLLPLWVSSFWIWVIPRNYYSHPTRKAERVKQA